MRVISMLLPPGWTTYTKPRAGNALIWASQGGAQVAWRKPMRPATDLSRSVRTAREGAPRALNAQPASERLPLPTPSLQSRCRLRSAFRRRSHEDNPGGVSTEAKGVAGMIVKLVVLQEDRVVIVDPDDDTLVVITDLVVGQQLLQPIEIAAVMKIEDPGIEHQLVVITVAATPEVTDDVVPDLRHAPAIDNRHIAEHERIRAAATG